MRRTIIACVIVALVAGTASATAAKLITGGDIKNGSITGADIKNPTITHDDIKKGTIIKKKLSKAVRDALDNQAATGPQGPAGAKGPAGSRGPAGPPGPAGPLVATELGVATVFVARGTAAPTRWASYSAPLASPGVTTSGHFRFSCSGTQAPCRVSLGAAVISTTRTDTAAFYPRMVIHKEATGGAPMTFCEYADGTTNALGVGQVVRARTVQAAMDAMAIPRSMGIGGSLDCGSDQTSTTGNVTEILVPGGSSGPTDPAFYDVWTTLAFGGAANG